MTTIPDPAQGHIRTSMWRPFDDPEAVAAVLSGPQPSPAARALIWAVTWWRAHISPLYARWDVCRYTPSCSAYALIALRLWGGRKGAWLAVKRITRCNPLSHGGHDPVPLPSLDEAWTLGPPCGKTGVTVNRPTIGHAPDPAETS